jgi:hypothetical protein
MDGRKQEPPSEEEMQSAKRFKASCLIALLVVSFGLNWLWEMAQMPAFVETAGQSWRGTALGCTAFSVADAGLILAIYGIIRISARRIPSIRGVKFYLLVCALGAIAAIFIELNAKAMGYWNYSEIMLTALGVGIWPVLQLAVLAPVSVWLASRYGGLQVTA